MEYTEFTEAYDMGVESNGITDPTLFGVDTVTEAKKELAKTISAPLRPETHVYRTTGADNERLVGINAYSKEHADKLLRWRGSGTLLCDYIGELNEVMGGDR